MREKDHEIEGVESLVVREDHSVSGTTKGWIVLREVMKGLEEKKVFYK